MKFSEILDIDRYADIDAYQVRGHRVSIHRELIWFLQNEGYFVDENGLSLTDNLVLKVRAFVEQRVANVIELTEFHGEEYIFQVFGRQENLAGYVDNEIQRLLGLLVDDPDTNVILHDRPDELCKACTVKPPGKEYALHCSLAGSIDRQVLAGIIGKKLNRLWAKSMLSFSIVEEAPVLGLRAIQLTMAAYRLLLLDL